MRDVEYLSVKGRFNLKALTPRAREVFGLEMGGPWQMASEIFMYGISPDKLDQTLARLRASGLQTEADKPEEINPDDFTTF
jgi:hypothetical protein